MGRLFAGLLVAAATLLAGGCFRDSAVATTRCVVGESTCSCRSGDSPCDDGLLCDDGNICRSARCEDGREGCACVDANLCLGDLECVEGSCLPPGADDSGNVTTTGVSTTVTAGTTAQPGTSESEVGPVTTGPIDTDDTSMTSGVGPTGGVDSCGCGWDTNDQGAGLYDCGFGLPPNSGDPTLPRECPDQVFAVGDPCGDITATGCCAGDIIVYCEPNTTRLWVDDCSAMPDITCGPSAPPMTMPPP